MSHNKENTNANTDKRDLGKISYSPFNLLDKTVEFPVQQDISLLTKQYDITAKSRRVLARDLMGHDEYDKLSRKNAQLAISGKYLFEPDIETKMWDEIFMEKVRRGEEKQEKENRERKHQEHIMKKLKYQQQQEELDRLWLEANPEQFVISVDTPRPKPSDTPKSKASLKKTKSISNFGSFFNLGGKKSQKKNTRQNRYKKQSKRY